MDIQVTDGRLHRLERAQKALRIFGVIAGIQNGQADLLIDRIIEDHGRLTIFWRHPPSDLQKLAWATAWTECKEHADRVFHTTV